MKNNAENAIKKVFFKNNSASISKPDTDFQSSLCDNMSAFPIPGSETESVFESLFRRDDNGKFTSAPDVENFLSVSKSASKTNPIKEESVNNPIKIDNREVYNEAVDNLISGLVEMSYLARLTYSDLLDEGYEKLLEASVNAVLVDQDFNYLGVSKARATKLNEELKFYRGLRKNLVENYTECNKNFVKAKVFALDKIMHEVTNSVVEVFESKPEKIKEGIYTVLNDWVNLLA